MDSRLVIVHGSISRATGIALALALSLAISMVARARDAWASQE